MTNEADAGNDPDYIKAEVHRLTEKAALQSRVIIAHERLAEFMTVHMKRATDNLSRVQNFISSAAILLDHSIHLVRARDMPIEQVREQSDDIVRAAVVFAHATLEEFLRSLSELLLPLCSEKILNKIPIASPDSRKKRGEPFLLGALLEYKEQTAEEIIRYSVQKYLEHTNYNNTTEIATLFQELGLDVKKVSQFFPDIEKAMQRRHNIVHRADRQITSTNKEAELLPIDAQEILTWIQSILNFCVQSRHMVEEQFFPADLKEAMKKL